MAPVITAAALIDRAANAKKKAPSTALQSLECVVGVVVVVVVVVVVDVCFKSFQHAQRTVLTDLRGQL